MKTLMTQIPQTQLTGHTPGPLTVDYSGPARLAIADKNGRQLAVMDLQCEDGDEDEANAKLFAAAPELLAALKWAQSRIFVHEGNSDVYEAARAAIAKL